MRLHKIFINRLPRDEAWGGGNMWVRAMHDHASKFGFEIVNDFRVNAIDAIVVCGFDADNSGVDFYRALNMASSNGHTKLIVRVNENDMRKGTNGVDRTMYSMMTMSHGTVFVSSWLQKYYALAFKNAPQTKFAIIHNGVDKEIFKMRRGPGTLEPKLRIVCHHWSNNPLKGFDVYDAIDRHASECQDIVFEYIGRDRGSFKGRNTHVIAPLHGAALGIQLGTVTCDQNVYVSGSRFDPGPNHVLESLACGYPTWVHNFSGGGVEFAGSDHMFGSIEELLELLKLENRQRLLTPNAFVPIDWETCVKHYCDFIDQIIRAS